VNTQSNHNGNPEVNNTDGLDDRIEDEDGINNNDNNDSDGDGVKNDDDQCPNQFGPKNNKGCPIKNDPLEKWIKDSIQARESLKKLYERFGGDFKGTSDCSKCDADSLKSCKDQMDFANQKWKDAVDALKKKRKPKKG